MLPRTACAEIGVSGSERTHQNIHDEPGSLGVLPAPAAVVKIADEVAGRFAQAQVLLAEPAERRVLRPGGVSEAPVTLGGRAGGLSRHDPDRVTGQPARLSGHVSWLSQRHGDAIEKQGGGWNADGLPRLDKT